MNITERLSYSAKTNSVLQCILPCNKKDLKEYIKGCTDIEITTEGWTPLHLAVLLSCEECVQLLTNYAGHIYAQDNEGKIPLHWASFNTVSFEVFKILCHSMEMNFGLRDQFGRTPLHYICMNKSLNEESSRDIHEAIKKIHLLFKLVDDIDVADHNGNTALHILCENIHNYAEWELINFHELSEDLKGYRSKTVCGLLVEMFSARGCNLFSLNTHGLSPLHSACRVLCVEMIRCFVSAGIPQELVNKSDTPPMSMVFSYQTVCKSLPYDCLDKQINWYDIIQYDHQSRFHDSLRPLMKTMRSFVDKRNMVSGTAIIHQAVADILCSSNVVKGIVEWAKGDTNLCDYLGKTPLHYIFEAKNELPSPLKEEAKCCWKDKIDILLRNGVVIDSQDICGNAPIHDAALYGEIDLLEILILNKSNVCLKNNNGASPLHLITINTRLDQDITLDRFERATNMLLQAGANINDKDSYGSTPLHYAVCSGNAKVVKILSGLGADKTIKDDIGESSESYCSNKYNVEFDTFISKGIKKEVYLNAVHINDANEWLRKNMNEFYLTDEKVSNLLEISEKENLSNDIDKNDVLRQILALMTAVFDEVERLDPRFNVSIELSGSTREGTKVAAPDEFDILCFLDSFESLIDIENTNNTQFVRCKRKDHKNMDYEEFCNDENSLMTNRITNTFYLLVKTCLSIPHVWVKTLGLSPTRENNDFPCAKDLPKILCLYFRYTNVVFKELLISCDIVPVIRQRKWWPSFARQSGIMNTESIKDSGCMIMCVPEPLVSLTGEMFVDYTHFKTSVYLSECMVIKSLPRPVISAYKLAKVILKQNNLYPSVSDASKEGDEFVNAYHPTRAGFIEFTSYQLKNVLFHELESGPIDVNKNTNNLQLTRDWTTRIFKRLYKCVAAENLTAYFLPVQKLILPRKNRMDVELECTILKMIVSILQGNVWDQQFTSEAQHGISSLPS